MRKAGDKLGYKLRTRLVQVLLLPTVSTDRTVCDFFNDLLYGLKSTVNAQLAGCFTQVFWTTSGLLAPKLCTVSTIPITNTNHIKEL